MSTIKMAALGSIIFLSFTNSYAIDEKETIMEGLPEHLIYLYTQESFTGNEPNHQDQLVVRERRWEPNRVLKVCMFGGNPRIATLIRSVAGEWNGVSSVSFDFGPLPGGYNCLVSQAGFYQVRVGFSERGYWSVLGRDSESRLDPLVPSMNLEGFNRVYSEARYPSGDIVSKAVAYDKAIIRHEFGHALGLLHEHQNPSLKCQDEIIWQGKGNVYEYFAGPPNHWSASQVQRNLGFIQDTDPDYQQGQPDPRSIMMYSLPENIFKNGKSSKCYVAVNYNISNKDKQIIASIYPTISQTQVAQLSADEQSKIKALPLSMAYSESKDIRHRILADLESNDDYVRRDARVRLTNYLQSDPKADVSSLVQQMQVASYRYKLGVAVALAKSSGKINLDTQTRENLAKLAMRERDSTLKANLESAVK
ncbi:hypothetical protein Q8O96_29670 [Pseudomonas sp. LPH60]|uniref:hypothetical protein n=1 Tax=Pseudomonas sp. LPH60 TaxID=3065906 RepID=UPI00273AE4BB|nr:hypothetical protein [Pseudomonas sp. LPH60]MDP4573242.1 hypothetical protein [Pseudomonas sp. LPH60]